MKICFDITNYDLTFVSDGVPKSIDSSHPNFEEVKTKLLDGSADLAELLKLVDTRVALEGRTFGLVTMGEDEVYYKEVPISGYLVDKLLAMIKDGVGVTPWALLLDRVMLNPLRSVRENLPKFLEECKMPITPEGHFLAWKLVGEDFMDCYNGTVNYKPGESPEMPRDQVDPNREATCSQGLHAAAFDYLPHYGFGSERKCVLVSIDPADVVAIPNDYNNQKLRTCKMYVIREVAKENVQTLYDRDQHVSSGFDFPDHDNDDNDDDYRHDEHYG